MRHYDTTFFCDQGKAPKAELQPKPEPGGDWPVSVKFRTDDWDDGTVSFHFKDESGFIAFKNSVLETYNKYRRVMGYDTEMKGGE